MIPATAVQPATPTGEEDRGLPVRHAPGGARPFLRGGRRDLRPVNSLGMKLRGSDLAMAQITARWPGALDKFEEFAEECEKVWFTFDPGLLVRTLVVFATGQSRFRTVTRISVPRMEDSWEKAKDGLRFAVNFLRANAGIEDESFCHPLCW